MENNIFAKNYLIRAILHLFVIPILFFCGQEETVAQKIDSITMQGIRQHMDSIASDATEGRFTGSRGYRKAADYGARIFREAGLYPGYTDEHGVKSYFQPVPFIRHNYGPITSLTIRKNGKDRTFEHSARNFAFIYPGMNYKNIPLAHPAFIGYGIHEPEYGWNDYAGLDVGGKWVILLDGIPPADSNNLVFPDTLRKKYADSRACELLKYNALIEHKAAGIIILPDKYAIENWETIVIRKYRFNYIRYAEADTDKNASPERILPYILLQPDVAHLLLADQTYDPMAHKGSYHSYILDNLEVRIAIDCKDEPFYCHNVLAIAPGTDSTLKDAYITVGAHLDHLGTIGNHVYNGANDDASGCVSILEAARAIAVHPTKRSVLFILYTSEEINLNGSAHFVKHPSIPMESISLNINIEQVGSKSRMFSGIWAIGSPQFKESFCEVGKSFVGTNLKYNSIEEMVYAIRDCDTYSFYKNKIPAIIIGDGFKEHHTPQDKIDMIDFDHLLIAAKYLYAFIVKFGNEQPLHDINIMKK